jgi:uncharacterized Zn finger protein
MLAMFYDFRPYVSVGRRLANARAYAAKQAKREGRELAPAKSAGRKIASTFWGQAWCDNLDRYSSFASRLARGRTYLRNGSVVDLQIKQGLIEAIVAGSEVYEVKIKIKTLPAKTWQSLKQDCARSINSLLDLLQGKFDEAVMQRMAQAEGGLFPKPAEIDMNCNCPDDASVCKHLAAVIYGVGTRLDAAPELLFSLRNVDHSQLITQAVAAENLEQSLAGDANSLAESDLSEMFGIDLVTSSTIPPAPTKKLKKPRASPAKATAKVVRSKSTAKSRAAAKPVKKPTKTVAGRKAK